MTVTLSEAAVLKVKDYLKAKDNENLALRIFVKGGGCSGLSYGMALDEARQDDEVISVQDIRVLIDPMSAPHLDGIQVDYVDSMMGGGFKIDNPNAIRSCGCGTSFRTAAAAGNPQRCGC